MHQSEKLDNSYSVLVLLKALGQGKTRLRTALTPEDRVQLVENMFHHVLKTLDAAPCIAEITVVTPEPENPYSTTLPAKCKLVADGDLGGVGINGLASAWQSLFALGKPLLIVHPDLPLLSIKDLERVAEAHAKADVVIGCDRSGHGTNLLAFRSGALSKFAFGENSCQVHMASCESKGLLVTSLRRPGIASDIDLPSDLSLLPAHLHRKIQYAGPA